MLRRALFVLTLATLANCSAETTEIPEKEVASTPENYFKNMALLSRELREFEERLLKEWSGMSLNHSAIHTITNEGQIGVYIPIEGGAGHSFFGVWYNQKTAELATTMMGIFIFNTDKNVVAKVEQNGKLRLNGVLTQQGKILSGFVFDEAGTQHDLKQMNGVDRSFGDWLNCVVGCLIDRGVPPELVGIALGLCISACGILKNTYLCASCLGALSWLGGRQIEYCFWDVCG